MNPSIVNVILAAAFGVFVWVVLKVRRFNQREKEIAAREIKQEYESKASKYLDGDLSARVDKSNERLGLKSNGSK